MPLVIPQSVSLLKNANSCNSAALNVTNEVNVNEDRNSVTCSEDSGISSTGGDDILSLANIKYNRSGPSPSRLLSGIYSIGTRNITESITRVRHIDTQKRVVKETARPNSASSDTSNSSETDSSEVVSRLALTEDKITRSNHGVTKTITKNWHIIIAIEVARI